MRIVIDQSGYDLLNIGDVAMLQSCVTRLRSQWPHAEIMVIAHDSERLASYCPDTIPIGPSLANRGFFRMLPRRPRLISEQIWKIAVPYFCGRFRRRSKPGARSTAIRAVKSADLVVASGGAYVTDTWWWHGAGVLSLLALAQRMGKPTAMFGQGIGPIRHLALRAQARAVFPRLDALGLREDRTGLNLALSFGVRPHSVTVTGDDALELTDCPVVAEAKALGVNLRVSDYASVNSAAAGTVGELVMETAGALRAPILALPVSRYAANADVDAVRALIQRGRCEPDTILDDIASPRALSSAAAGCRAIVTGSYHAAVFGLAHGVPAVCLTKSRYYDAKFGGLRAMFPDTCFVVSLAEPDFPSRLRSTIERAWYLPVAERGAARAKANQLREIGRNAYARLKSTIESSPVRLSSNSQEVRMPKATASRDYSMVALGSEDRFRPARMLDVELTNPIPAIAPDVQFSRVWVLGRLHSEPVGVSVVPIGRAGVSADRLSELLWQDLREPIVERYAAAGLPEPEALPGDGLKANSATWPFLQDRSAALASVPFISVVVCTRDRPEQLESCLVSLAQQEYSKFEVVVVDNAPTSDAVRKLVATEVRDMAVRYVAERRAGLSWARNAGVAAASGEIVAFVDDDEEPDRYWLAGLATGFARGTDVGCVSGLVLPARLDTEAQEVFELLGGHRKGRGFSSAVFSQHGPQSPLYPLPPFGVGANMAFRRDALTRIGGFDVALGAGTPTLSGEDTLAFTMVLLAGYRIAYEPAALMRHHHRHDMESLGLQLQGYSVGLTAYYAALLRHRPSTLPRLIGLVPIAARYLRTPSVTSVAIPKGFLASVGPRQRWWMLAGPLAYVFSVRRQARVVAQEART